jgi:hypothetical protein
MPNLSMSKGNAIRSDALVSQRTFIISMKDRLTRFPDGANALIAIARCGF